MSGLKGLLDRVKKAEIRPATNANAMNQAGPKKPAYLALQYDLEHKQLTRDELIALLEQMLAGLKQSPTITEKARKGLLLAFFRLAFSQKPRTTGCFHPSEIATEDRVCHRKMYFQKADIDSDITFLKFTSDNRMKRLVELGTMIHLYLQENLTRKEIMTDLEVEVEMPEYGISGHTDGLVMFEGVDDLGQYYEAEEMISEIKSISAYGFAALRQPKADHIKQASIYGNLLGKRRICFHYYNKNDSDFKVYVWEVNDEYAEAFKKLAKGIIRIYNNNVKATGSTDITLHTLPERKICRKRTDERAMNCPFADTCFKLT